MTPASIRNKNPGAMYPGPSSKRFGSTTHEVLHSKDGEHKIATFADNVSGAAALFDLLSSPAYVGRPISKAIEKWCGGFYVSTYIHVIEQNGGVTRDTPLTRDLMSDPAIAIPIGKAMALQEAGCDFPMSDADWSAAHARAFSVTAPAVDTVASSPPPVKPLVKSRTIWTLGSATSLLTWLASYVDTGLHVATEAASKFSQTAGIRDTLGMVGGNGKHIAITIGIGCLVSAISLVVGDKTPKPAPAPEAEQ